MTSSDTAPSALRAGAELEIEFTDVLANGQGVGRASGIVVFCFGPLPGERARVRIETVKQRYAVAEMLELLVASRERARPFCPVFGACGGCQLQHLAYDAQLRWKRDVVRNALLRIGGLPDVEVRETIGMNEPRAYRNKMAVVVDHSSKPPALGFYRQRSHDVVPIVACPIVTPQLDAVLGALAEQRRDSTFATMLRNARHLVARVARATGQVVLTVTTTDALVDAKSIARSLRRELPAVAGVGNSYGPASENAILGRHYQLLAGEGEIEESVGGLRYRISAASFFQINVEILERIFDLIEPWLEPPGNIVDLYCGSGTFALYFARHGWNVTGIEENRHAIAEAQENARLNELEGRARFEAGRVEQMVGVPEVARTLQEAGVVFLDPPRKGCEEVVLSAIAQARVRNVWYLSCDAATLARDLKFLASKGYRPGVVQPFDMFPQTGHVETLVQLEHFEIDTRHD
ncbi:MAG: 23S rRNA (uracil(1939)-C(5))-methyltransferase RlmD [Candidatus Cybelea sp.]